MLKWFQRKFSNIEKDPELTDEQKHILMSLLFQNPSLQLYLNKRERFLVESSVDALLEGKVPDSKFLAGRLHEIRELRETMKVSHNRVVREKEESRARTKVVGTSTTAMSA